MMYKILNTVRRRIRDMQEQRAPRVRRINGQFHAYCRVRRAWVPIRWKGE